MTRDFEANIAKAIEFVKSRGKEVGGSTGLCKPFTLIATTGLDGIDEKTTEVGALGQIGLSLGETVMPLVTLEELVLGFVGSSDVEAVLVTGQIPEGRKHLVGFVPGEDKICVADSGCMGGRMDLEPTVNGVAGFLNNRFGMDKDPENIISIAIAADRGVWEQRAVGVGLDLGEWEDMIPTNLCVIAWGE